ncbi:MAG: hypothetical protein U5L96_02655 [Owenweeksia sp.]|nr:hypothetical protein [Owenweeksia sp.]
MRINVVLGGLEYWCTGTRINNTALNFKPYVLTAEHCGLTGSNQIASAGDLDKWQFFFNYSGNGCANPNSENEVNFSSITGSEFVSRSDDNGGDFGSDFLLLKLTDTTSFNQLNRPYFAGWNRADSKPLRGVSIPPPRR